MRFSSHRFRVQEKKIIKKMAFSVFLLTAVSILSVFIGLPLFAKGILFLSSFRPDSQTANKTPENTLIFAPNFNPLPEATNSAKITLTGFGEPNATVKILVNDDVQSKATTDAEGNFTVLNIKLKEGTNTIAAVNILDKKESVQSVPLSIIYKKDPPKLEITSPKNGDKFSRESEQIDISGATDPGAKIIINDRFVIVDSEGKFSFRVKLSSGENTYKIIAQDLAGNTKEDEIKVSFSPD